MRKVIEVTEVLDAEMKDECHVMLLVRRPDGDRWEDYGSVRRVVNKVQRGIINWTGKDEPPEWWEGKKNV
jgi:hypothetical protein